MGLLNASVPVYVIAPLAVSVTLSSDKVDEEATDMVGWGEIPGHTV